MVSSAAAQGVLAPIAPYYPSQTPAPTTSAPASSTDTGTDEAAAPATAAEAGLAKSEDLLKWGFARLRPHVAYRVYYADGLQSAPGVQSSSTIHEIAPGISLALGRHWTLDYTPTIRFYSNSRFEDGVDHSLALTGQTTYDDWSLGLSQTYARYTQPLVETAGQTGLSSIGTRISASRPLGGAWSLDLSLGQTVGLMDSNATNQPVADSWVWSTMDWLNYQLASKITLGLGVGAEYDEVSGQSANMTAEQFQGRISWKASQKLSFTVNGGMETRQFLDSQVSDAINPVFGATATYRPVETTTIALTASRSVSPAYFQGTMSESTTISLALQQRLLKKLSLGLDGGYSRSSYSATVADVTTDRNDDYVFVGTRLSLNFLKRGTISVFYHYSDNWSNQSLYKYASNQAGLEIGYYF